ncbi:MAG: glutamine synthetase, partial [Kordiimonas sp.]
MPSENTENASLRPQDIKDDHYVKIGITDHDGVLRGKYISGKKFQSALKNEASFCDVILGWDRDDQTIDALILTGWHTGFPDAPIKLLPETLRILPHENNVPFCLASFSDKYIPFCPRAILSSVCDKAESMGFSVLTGMEFEFSVFKETPTSVREKNYQELTPMAPGSHSYSLLRTSVGHDFYHQIIDTANAMDIP